MVSRLLILLTLLYGAAMAQNVRMDNIALGPRGPIPNATVAVCTQPANTSTTPCTPQATLCTSLTDPACVQPGVVTADTLGNYHFYVPISQGPVTVQIYGPAVAAPYITPDQSLPLNTIGFSKSLNNVLWADQFPGSDIGAKINAAYAALPAAGGEIDKIGRASCRERV